MPYFAFLNWHLVLLCALKLVENNRRELFLGDRWSFLRQARDLVQLVKVFIELTRIDVVLRRLSKSFCERLHMGQFLQGGKNGRLMSFFFFKK